MNLTTPIVDHMYHVNTGEQLPVVAYQRYRVIARHDDVALVEFRLTDDYAAVCELSQVDADQLSDEGRIAFELDPIDDYHRTFSDAPTAYPIHRLEDGTEVLAPRNAIYRIVVRYVTVRHPFRSDDDYVSVC